MDIPYWSCHPRFLVSYSIHSPVACNVVIWRWTVRIGSSNFSDNSTVLIPGFRRIKERICRQSAKFLLKFRDFFTFWWTFFSFGAEHKPTLRDFHSSRIYRVKDVEALGNRSKIRFRRNIRSARYSTRQVCCDHPLRWTLSLSAVLQKRVQSHQIQHLQHIQSGQMWKYNCWEIEFLQVKNHMS